MNFALWAVAVAPAWLVVRQFGVEGSTEAVSSAVGTDTPDYKGVVTKDSEGLP